MDYYCVLDDNECDILDEISHEIQYSYGWVNGEKPPYIDYKECNQYNENADNHQRIDNVYCKIIISTYLNDPVNMNDIDTNNQPLIICLAIVASRWSKDTNMLNMLCQYIDDKNVLSRLLDCSCYGNQNLCIIEYLVNKLNYFDDKLEILRLLSWTILMNENPKIAAYLYNLSTFERQIDVYEWHIYHNLTREQLERLRKFISYVLLNCPDNDKFNNFLHSIILRHGLDIIDHVKTLNPLFLNKHILQTIGLNPQNIEYKNFVAYIDDAIIQIPTNFWLNFDSDNDHFDIDNTTNDTIHIIDLTKPTTPIFKHNGIIYYGDMDRFFESMVIFDDLTTSLTNNVNHDELIILEGVQPKYIMNMYAYCAMTDQIMFDIIEPLDIIGFIKLIDQYPLKKLTIRSLETKIINHFEKHKILYDQYMFDICKKYKLRLMYMFIHNQKLAARSAAKYNLLQEYETYNV